MPTLKELDAMRTAANRLRAAAEAPIRTARRPLSDRLRKVLAAIEKTNRKIARVIYDAAFCSLYRHRRDYDLPPLEVTLKAQRESYRQALLNLQLYDAAHGVDADYAPLTEVDRAATEAQAKADYAASMARAHDWVRIQQMDIP